MRFCNGQHQHWCGIDLHARTRYVCNLDAPGQVLVHKNLRSAPEAFLETIEPYREGLVVAVECIFTWYWLADVCSREGIDFVLGHALYMKAIHGGNAKNDRVDALKIATRLRGGMLPQAYAYPSGMRATRDLLRRRLHLVRKRGQLLAHIQMTSHQYNLPPLGKRIAYPANREGIAEHFESRVVRQSIAVDLALLERYDALITELEPSKVEPQRDAEARSRDRSLPEEEDVRGVMGTNTWQRAALDWTPSLAPTHSRGPRALPDLCPSPEPGTNGRRAVGARRQHLSVAWDGMRERTCF
jgi:Transposase